jgi:DeoR/GlpR family transcriptional regulator of sugar metabolism
MEQSQKVVLLVDSGKFGQQALSRALRDRRESTWS